MGVQGLWSILNCSGQDIDVSVLEGKILAIDLSIWLNQALKSSNDSPSAHLQILFNRICKLLFYKIKPVFVFDGPTPTIKKHALEIRRKSRQLKHDKTEEIRTNIINILMKKNIINKRMVPMKKVKEQSDIFQLSDDKAEWIKNWRPALESEFTEIAMDYINNFSDIDDVDIESQSFHSLPLEVQHEVLRTVSKEKRYGWDTSQNSYHDMKSKEFSDLQIKRLIERNNLHNRVDNLKSIMNERDGRQILSSSNLNDIGDFSTATISAKKIISHDTGYLMLINPINDDLVENLSQSKKEATLKGTKRKSNDEDIVTENSNKSYDENDKLLDEEDFCSMMECVSKLKRNIRDDGVNIKKLCPSDTNISPIECNPSLKDHIFERNETISVENDDFKNERNEFKKIVNENMDTEITDKESILPPSNRFCRDIETDKNDSLGDDNSDNDSDFVDVSDKDDQNSDDQEITKRDLELTVEEQNFIFASLDNQSKEGVNSDHLNNGGFSEEDLYDIINAPNAWNTSVDNSLSQLYEEEQKLDHQTVTVSEHYFQEAKELLKLFGIPYVESLAEAEAQCAFLENAGLTDGTITEDSDVWLFGGKTVYKHMFTRGFNVREYSSRRIYKKLGLGRDLMICIAMLSGGDYTPGIYGVGPVNAMEILAEFSDPDDPMTNFRVLEIFKNWSDRHKNNPKLSVSSERKRFLRFELDDNFPDRAVYDAYNYPLVDESLDPFVWNSPATDKLIEYVHRRVGWEKLKIIEMLESALKNNSISNVSQKKITDFFVESDNDYRKLPSKRLKQATKQRNLIVNNSKT